jgi:hypothetical protein
MHNLFLGLIKEHFEGILGISLPKEEKEVVVQIVLSNEWKDFTPNEQKSVRKLKKWLESPISDDLKSDERRWLTKFTRCHGRALAFVCAELQCHSPSNEHPDTRRVSNSAWAKVLLAWVSYFLGSKLIFTNDCPQRVQQVEQRLPHASSSTTLGHVLSADEMEEIRSDIKKIVMPSWMTSVPANLGSSGHGKLKADQWRVLGTTYIPITLVRLWGNGGRDERSKRCKKILEVTLSLLSAIVTASARVTSSAHANLYIHYMQAYLNGIKDLFPTYKFDPKHHMALHLYEYLLRYGPVHAWWTFPFERIIGMLQRIPTNGKLGEYEETIASSFTKSANLRGVIQKIESPEALQHCQPLFEKMMDPQVRNTLVTDMLAVTSLHDGQDTDEDCVWNERSTSVIPQDLHRTLCSSIDSNCPRRAQFLSHLTIKGLTYTVSSKHSGNSNVLLEMEPSSEPIPARIAHILRIHISDGVQTYLVVQRYQSCVKNNPFSHFPMLRARAWKRQLHAPEAFPLDCIHSHFAKYGMTWQGIDVDIVMSLSRVSLLKRVLDISDQVPFRNRLFPVVLLTVVYAYEIPV